MPNWYVWRGCEASGVRKQKEEVWRGERRGEGGREGSEGKMKRSDKRPREESKSG